MNQSIVSWSCSATSRSVTGNGIPDHATGTFPNVNCPNTIRTTTVAASMPIQPVNTGTATRAIVVGYNMNGVKFDPGTAGTCDNSGSNCSLIGGSGSWSIEALGQSNFNFGVDSSNAHVQPTGDYHYHGMPEGSLSGVGQAMKLVGFSIDGFPIYARYGRTVANDANSAIKLITSSFRLKSTPSANRPSTATYPMGAFTQDYEYAAGTGDLDECNGRFGVTPEFPAGIYHYYITDSYPFIQRCVKGTSTPGGQQDGGVMGMCQPGQTSMCCGDQVCDGPETHASCPSDC